MRNYCKYLLPLGLMGLVLHCPGPLLGQKQPAENKVVEGAEKSVVLVIDESLLKGIRTGLTQFAKDLGKQGYTVYEKPSRFTTPPQLRSYLSDLYNRTEKKLVGAILIGNLPRAYQFVTTTPTNPKIAPLAEEVISFQYYSDLDGEFDKSKAFKSPGKRQFTYDLHQGNTDWEIWIGVLPMYNGNPNLTVQAINRYFARNHAYREGPSKLPRAFLQISEHHKAVKTEDHQKLLDDLRNGQYAWTPFSSDPSALIYFDSPSAKLSVEKGYADLSKGVADFTAVDTHGNWQSSGKINIAWVEKNPVKTIFFWSNGCAVGNLDYPANFLTSVLYSPTSMVLIARGTTNDSGGMGSNKKGCFTHNVATAMTNGETFGDALLSHVNTPLLAPWSNAREFHFGTSITLGDPTLRLRPAEEKKDPTLRLAH